MYSKNDHECNEEKKQRRSHCKKSEVILSFVAYLTIQQTQHRHIFMTIIIEEAAPREENKKRNKNSKKKLICYSLQCVSP